MLFEFEEDNAEEWRAFSSEDELTDFVRRDSGEPIQIPATSLDPAESERVVQAANDICAKTAEEFRR